MTNPKSKSKPKPANPKPQDQLLRLQAKRQRSLKRLFAGGKPLNSDQKAELRKMGIAVGDEAPAPEGTTQPALIEVTPNKEDTKAELLGRKCDTQAYLAACLQSYYAGTIAGLSIKNTHISDWLRGRGVPAGATNAPPMHGNYYHVAEWVAWFDKWKLSKYVAHFGESEHGELSAKARAADLLSKINKGAIIAQDLARKEERLVERSLVDQLCLGLAQWVSVEHAKIEQLPVELAGQLRESGLPEARQSQLITWWTDRVRDFNSTWLAGAKSHLEKMATEAQANAAELAEKEQI